jgi:periplasmic divalent cation tolerance protein
MKMYYITLNNSNEAKAISYALLENKLAVCTNWFDIHCAYRWQDEIRDEPEVVLIVKTKENMREEIEKTVYRFVDYTNCIAEINIHSANEKFLHWLGSEV